jgi:thiamine-phosphate pyrophosphorylase
MASVLLPKLLAITDVTRCPAPELLKRARVLCGEAAPGSVAVLLRDHESSVRERLRLGRALRELTRAAGQELWVADRLDLVLLLQADGAHLGEASVPALEARQLLATGVRISRAWHGVGPSDELAGVDALLVSPIFEARKGRPALGIAALRDVARELDRIGSSARVYALGGVSASNAPACLAAAAGGVAAIGAAWADDAHPLLAALGATRGSA